ncbi:TPA: heterodisulfide reductase subunit B [bacterium]|nr:heterodisulfide reductase subunit B [bacterium]
MKEYAYYPGCSLHSTGREYDVSLKSVCKLLDIEFREIKDWICCGSTPAHNISKIVSIALSVKNIELVKKMGAKEVVTPCVACFSRFKAAIYDLQNEEGLKDKLKKIMPYSDDEIKVLHPLEIFSQDEILTKINNIKKKDLSGLKVVCYYGCLLTRPPKVTRFDECEYPQTMDKILGSVGIVTLDWSYKTDCCGASFSLTIPEIVIKLSADILNEARLVGAEAIAVACPLCHINLDGRQADIKKAYHRDYEIPILYFTQLVGLSLGILSDKLLLDKHFVDTTRLLSVNKV